MRINIMIADDLMEEVLRLTGAKTKKDAVEMGLKALIRLKRQEKIKCYKGKLHWEGNLDDTRTR